MNRLSSASLARRFCLLLTALLLTTGTSYAGRIDAQLQQKLAAAAAGDTVRVLIRFADRADLAAYAKRIDRKQARRELVQDLRGRATRAQGPLQAHLRQQKHPFTELWLINAVAVELPAAQVAALADWPGVASIEAVGTTAPPAPLPQAAATVADDWNLTAIGAQALWAPPLSITGSGVVVAVLDTGVNPNHPELVGKFRNLPGDWYDPYGSTTTPYDPVSPTIGLTHGTAVTSVILGKNVGVAPSAQWIAAKIFPDSGGADNAFISASFQWALDPNKDGNPDDAPDIVNNSWGFENSPNLCLNIFQAEIQTLQAAGIHVVFAAGNLGPNARTSISPANNPEGFAVGSVGADMSVSNLSSRGPSPCSTSIYTPPGATDVFPEIVAPGDGVLVATGASGYAYAAGTSLSAPHISGALALLRQAVPAGALSALDYRRNLEFALLDSAADLDLSGPDNNAGYGLLDIPAAFYRLDGQPSLAIYTPGAPENDSIVDFGNVPPGTGSTLNLRLDNVGGSILNLTSISTATVTAPFTVEDNNCTATLAADASCTISLHFNPADSGPATSSLQITSNDPRQPSRTITLQGTGNTAPPVAILTAPTDGATNQPAAGVVFHWYQGDDADGDPLTMTLTIDDSLIFFTPLEFVLQFSATGGIVLVGLLPLLGYRRWRRNLAWLAVAALLTGLTAFAGCGGGGGGTSVSANAGWTVTTLSPDTTYYWKVVTTDNNGNPVESSVRSFTTAP